MFALKWNEINFWKTEAKPKRPQNVKINTNVYLKCIKRSRQRGLLPYSVMASIEFPQFSPACMGYLFNHFPSWARRDVFTYFAVLCASHHSFIFIIFIYLLAYFFLRLFIYTYILCVRVCLLDISTPAHDTLNWRPMKRGHFNELRINLHSPARWSFAFNGK